MSILKIDPAIGTFPKGQRFNFDIQLDGPDQVNAATVDLTWPAARLKLVDSNFSGSALPGEAEFLIQDGHCRISRFILPSGGTVTPISGPQFIGTLVFEVLDGGGARIKFSSSCEVLRHGDAQNVLTVKNDGAYVLSPTGRAHLTESIQEASDAVDRAKTRGA